MKHLEDPCAIHPCTPGRYSDLGRLYARQAVRQYRGPLTLALSLRERERRRLRLQHLLDQPIGFCHMPVHEEGER